MSKTLQQIFAANPITSNISTDLMYFVQSPYTPGTDAGMTFANFSNQFVLSTAILNPAHGGTGINNGSSTITLGGSLTTIGAFPVTLNFIGATNVIFPTAGTLATTSQIPSFPLSLANGGTNAALTASNGGIVWSNASQLQILAGTATAGQILRSGANATPTWSTSTYPAGSVTSGLFLISDGTNFVASTSTIPTSAGATANKVLISNGTNYVLSTPTFPASASATTRKIIVSDGTNWVASTETYAVPGTSGNVLTSDGTNWTSAPPAVTTVLTTKGDILGFSTVDARIPVGTTNGQILQVSSGAAVGVAYSTPTYPSTSGGAGTILRSDGTNNLYTTTTYPNTNAVNTIMYASSANVLGVISAVNGGVLVSNNTGVPSMLANPAAVGKVLQSANAAIPTWSTPTFPTGSGASGAVLISDGTNYVASTSLWPNTVGTSGKIVISNGTSNVYSTPTFPNASATTRKIIVSDGTNWVASTETWAVPGTSGNFLSSDGTNWTSATLLALANGGTGAALTANNGGIVWSNASTLAILAGTATAGLALLSGTTGAPTWSNNAPITKVNVQVITTTGTYTPTTGTKFGIAFIWGAGGGSTGSGTSAGTAAGAGGTTSLGAIASASGGAAGSINTTPSNAAGGTGTGGTLNLTGSNAQIGGNITGSTANGVGPIGGSAPMIGIFGAGTLWTTASIAPPANTGAGAGAAGGGTSAVAGNAGGGGGLAVYLWASPTSQTVTIGAGGTAGGAGGAGNAGSIGSKGLFMIIEFIST